MRFLVVSYFLLTAGSFVSAIWPEPAHYTHGDTVVLLDPSVRFTYQRGEFRVYDEGGSYFTASMDYGRLMRMLEPQWFGIGNLHPNSEKSVDDILKKAIKRTRKELRRTRFVPWKFHPRNQSFELRSLRREEAIKEILIEEAPSDDEILSRDYISGDESYEIRITKKGKATILTASPIGTLRALQTLPQLFYAHSFGGVYTPYAPISISDKPKWSHRGLNLDISRNPIGPNDVKRTIDAMASVKLNRLHIHATDSQSWPLDIPSLPSLAAKAAYHPRLVWSSSDLRNVQKYGLARGVSTFIEIDMPGHTGSIGHAFPDLLVAFGNDSWDKYALEPPCGQVKLNDSAVRRFFDTVMADILPRVSPFTAYFHTGGDEFNLQSYMLEETIRSNDPKVLKPLLQDFVNRVHMQIMEAGLTPIVWEELVLDWDLTFPSQQSETRGIIVQAWRNSTAVRQILEKGYRTIFGSGDAWYLDCGVGGFINPRPGSGAVKEPYLDWCSPTKNWRHIYTYNPLEGIPEELQSLLEGGETHMWAENVDPVNMDQMIWPRAASAAEVLWSGPRARDDIKEASHRLGKWRERAVIDMGVGASMVQMTYCLMREGSCEL
ncbi:N-acetyl-beta-glucosaminidase, putative [Coccidioides posadasii C735 delta SOWgp]|uniref:Beta-hexosaminidase n=3 Tax=Coccidioides posadasii TaxID=199306 RepID=A7XUU4_COCPS|nr:N-acetyl-beta-glucosaminidase, putative [Coccidioides posadasii C735 delta SOWgp]ABU87865.1 chitobiase 2 [Coccidioides posadasii str. Silveira]EER23897.1 N-acetyl-beta-glucosaminidase, putative [Coccidioides posadasii C735 delta SOWgp]EFW21952.1 beta-hexosaminidase subunit beta [Coccidioides posadasii str. Silveira]KMM65413.1 beta-hexosaminidase beta chain [Coccidioides posadasii RMSCC 3488]|eukprot:XP_003066042.1 N-acetyl-beta-glucosaminidase, putative [Coccidioides posadasii C735 delta SOWgp]